MLMWSIIALSTIGNFEILSKSLNTPIMDFSVYVSSTDNYCRDYPPPCPGDKLYDDLSDLELFQQAFCPSQRKLECLVEYAQRCLPSVMIYYEFLRQVSARSRALITELPLCSNGPHKKEHLHHAACLVSMLRSSNGSTPLCAVVEDYEHRHQLGAKEVDCILRAVRNHCGKKTEHLFNTHILQNPDRIYYMSTELFIAIFIIGNFMIPTESTILLENTNLNHITPTRTKLIKNTTIPFKNIDQLDNVGIEDYFCTIFPPPNCFENETSNNFKTDVEFFREQFCPRQVTSLVPYNMTVASIYNNERIISTLTKLIKNHPLYRHRSFQCMEEFGRRCLSSGRHYYNYLIKLLARSRVVLQLDLCTKAPHNIDNLKHVECIGSDRKMFRGVCPRKHGYSNRFSNVTSLVGLKLQMYVECVLKFAVVACGEETATFLQDYTYAMNITSNVNDSKRLRSPNINF